MSRRTTAPNAPGCAGTLERAWAEPASDPEQMRPLWCWQVGADDARADLSLYCQGRTRTLDLRGRTDTKRPTCPPLLASLARPGGPAFQAHHCWGSRTGACAQPDKRLRWTHVRSLLAARLTPTSLAPFGCPVVSCRLASGPGRCRARGGPDCSAGTRPATRGEISRPFPT